MNPIEHIGLIHTVRILARVAPPTKPAIFTQNRADLACIETIPSHGDLDDLPSGISQTS